MSTNRELLREFRQLVAELSLVSHISGTAYEGKTVRATDESKGGRKPAGGDFDKPARPRDGASVDTMREYYDALESWKDSYQRRTPAYFAAEFDKCSTRTRLIELIDEARTTVDAWTRAPQPKGEEPLSMADPQWRWWVATVDRKTWTVAKIVNRYGCSRQYINQIWSGTGVQFDAGEEREKEIERRRDKARKAAEREKRKAA